MTTYLIFQLVDVVVCCFGRRHAPEAGGVIGSGYGALEVEIQGKICTGSEELGRYVNGLDALNDPGSSSRQFSNA
jgi:hypothetical protein